jgi:hypothetical protein
MKVQIVTPYRVSHLQRYGVTLRGNVTSVYPTLTASARDIVHTIGVHGLYVTAWLQGNR